VHVFDDGAFPARYWEEKDGINLPDGFFVEVYYDTRINQIVQLRSFTSSAALDNYMLSIELPEDLQKSSGRSGRGFFYLTNHLSNCSTFSTDGQVYLN
jgi:hypothetical protein